MTAETLDFTGVGSWRFRSTTNGTQQARSYIERNMYEQPVATQGHEHSYAKRTEILTRLLELAGKAPQVQPAALVRVYDWLQKLPEALPNPFVAIGEDGSISTEWDADGSSLHVTFDEDTEEVYFFSRDSNEEWESTLDAVDKVSSAMRSIAVSISARK